MSVEEECELKQLVSSDEESNLKEDSAVVSQVAPATSTAASSLSFIKSSQILRKQSGEHSHRTSKASSSADNSSIHGETNFGSKILRNTSIVPTGSSNSSAHVNASSSGHTGSMRVNPDHKPPRPPQPNLSRLQSKKDVMDVRQMEQALLHLLEDFHSGKLRAFGKGCSMEQMTAIHEQQEHLARLHFELGAQQELFVPLSNEGLMQGADNMKSLMDNLEQLSLSIERLHSINKTSDIS